MVRKPERNHEAYLNLVSSQVLDKLTEYYNMGEQALNTKRLKITTIKNKSE